MIVNFPTDNSCVVEKFTFGQKRQDVLFRSNFGSQAMEVSSPLWTVDISAPTNYESVSGAWQALIMKLKGQVNQLAIWNLGRPVPSGDMRGSMTLSSSAAQGATSLVITAGSGQAAKTLKAGDMLGLGSGTVQQLVMLMSDATANGSGVITVTVEPPLRNAFVSGSVVVWDKPCALFRRSDSKSAWEYSVNMASGFSLNLIEDVRP